MFINPAERQQDVCMRISVSLVMKCPVSDHALGNKSVPDITPDTFDLILSCHFRWKSDFDLTCELCIRSLFDLLDFIPKNLTVRKPLRCIFRKKDLAHNDSAFTGKVVCHASLAVIQFLAGSVCSRSHSGSATRAADDLYRAMVY